MEKIIIYAFIIAIVALFDYIKKRAKGTQSPKKVNSPRPNRPVPPDIQPMAVATQPISTPRQQPKPSTPPKQPQQFLPGEEVDDMILPMEETPKPETMTGERTSQQNAEHYARWRQAIIDAEILQRKF